MTIINNLLNTVALLATGKQISYSLKIIHFTRYTKILDQQGFYCDHSVQSIRILVI